MFVADLVKNKAASNAARNMLKRLKTLRHPKILRLIEGVEVHLSFQPLGIDTGIGRW